jgi:hypothetical protein
LTVPIATAVVLIARSVIRTRPAREEGSSNDPREGSMQRVGNDGRRRGLLATLAGSAVVLALAGAPFVGFGADHLDAPDLMPPSDRADADINDLYVFEARRADRTVIAVSTHPGAGAIAPLEYATDVAYKMKVDGNGDAVQDFAFVWLFNEANDNGIQKYKVLRQGRRGHFVRIAVGRTGRVADVDGGGKAFAGLRSDPFFFDLDAFRDQVGGAGGGRTFCDGSETDFFADLNANAMVLQLPDGDLGRDVGVWATTNAGSTKIDRMGRPAINTVFNAGADKDLFNVANPARDRVRFGDNVVGVLQAFSALDMEGAYADAEAEGLADVLLPDILTYDTRTPAAGPLNGRALADDVIDVELNIVTGGFGFGGRDDTGAIPSDCVGPHGDYLNRFPYLGEAHS